MSEFVVQYQIAGGEEEEFTLSAGDILVGRGTDCDVVLDDCEVSRKHARFHEERGIVNLIDLGSSNGTFVDSKRIEPNVPYLLSPNQTVSMGGCVFVLKPAAQEVTYAQAVEADLGLRFRVRYHSEIGQPAQYLLPPGETSIGRSSANDLYLDQEELSRNHAAFYVEGNKFFVADLGSTNGTFLDHAQLTPHQQYPFHPGQALTMGGIRFLLNP